MKIQKSSKLFQASMVILISAFMLLGTTGLTADAAPKATVRKITSVNSLKGSGTIKLAKGKQAAAMMSYGRLVIHPPF